jgi:hypothetical protein
MLLLEDTLFDYWNSCTVITIHHNLNILRRWFCFSLHAEIFPIIISQNKALGNPLVSRERKFNLSLSLSLYIFASALMQVLNKTLCFCIFLIFHHYMGDLSAALTIIPFLFYQGCNSKPVPKFFNGKWLVSSFSWFLIINSYS